MNDRLLPPRLTEGDRIGVVTPSWPIMLSPSPDPRGELERGMEALRELSFQPVLGRHALERTGYTAGSPKDRASDINEMFADPSIRAIIASHGGQLAHGVLRHLDWDLIRSTPKIFMGFSNITTLNLAIYARTGLLTFHGNMVMWHLGMNPSDYDLTELVAVLAEGRTGPVPKNSEWRTVRHGELGEGRLIGEATGLRAWREPPTRRPSTKT